MDPFVVLALAVMLVALAAAIAAAIALRGRLRVLTSTVRGAQARIRPLADELAAETAATALELDAIRRTRGAEHLGDTPQRGT